MILLPMRYDFACLSLALVLTVTISAPAQSQPPVEVAPGITLPAQGDGTVYGLDQQSSGPVLVHIVPNETFWNTRTPGNVMRGLVYVGPRGNLEVKEPHSATVITTLKPVLFVRPSGDSAELMRQRVHLIWLQSNNGKTRQVFDYSQNIFGGQRARSVDEVPCDVVSVEGTNWIRITPKDPLVPGEFAIAFLPKDVNQFPDAVYDFSVPGKSADANPYGGKPAESKK